MVPCRVNMLETRRNMYTKSFALGALVIFFTSCLTSVIGQRQKCLFSSNYCSGGYKMKAVCRDGYCVCSGQGYDYNTCLPDAYGCKIVVNSDAALAKPKYNNQQRQTTYSCTPARSSSQYEVHVLSVNEVINRRPPTAGDANVNIVSHRRSDRPVVLVLSSYEPVNWILHVPSDITVSKVILVAYYLDESSVSGDVKRVQAVERKSTLASEWEMGYGSDSGGGDTVGFLKNVYNRFGVVTSFTGTYRADEWSLVLSSSNGSGFSGNFSTAATTTTTTTPTVTTTPAPLPTANVQREKCYKWLNSYYCSGQYGKTKAVCRDGYCVCTGQGYDSITCLPNTNGCKITVNARTALAKPRYNNQQRQTTYSCTPAKSSSQYEVHVLSVYEVINRRPPTAGDANVNIVSHGKPDRPIVLVLSSYEPVNWILHVPSDITVSKVILVAYYVDESSVRGDVNRIQAVERKGGRGSIWGGGIGSDSGGGDTVGFLKQVYDKFGVVTSFTGTYRADEWSLNVFSPHKDKDKEIVKPESTKPSCESFSCLSEAVQRLNERVEMLSEEAENQKMRIVALEEIKKNNRPQSDESFAPQSSSCASIFKTFKKLAGILLATFMMITNVHFVM